MADTILDHTFAANGDSPVFIGGLLYNPAHGLTISVSGTFGGGTVTLKASKDGVTFVSTGITLMADGIIETNLRALQFKLTLAGATNPDIDAWAI